MSYTTDTIQKLDFFEAVRKYPGMYIGSKDEDGLHHLAKEIISNSIDEYLNGCCQNINVILQKDGSLCVIDDGRGIPIGEKENGKTALELCFTEEHAGGKFLNSTGTSGYNSAGGMHGLGSKCVNALSDWMEITTTRDGKSENIKFVNGIKTIHKTINVSNELHGTKVVFKPSEKYLETVNFNSKRLKTLIKEFSFLCKGLTFTYKDNIEDTDTETETFVSKNGLYDYLEYLNKDKEMLCKPFYFEESDGTFNVEVAFGYNNSYGSEIKLYTNNIPQNKGTHLTGFKTALTITVNQFAKEKKWLKDKDANLAGTDLEEGLLLIINFKMIDPVFKGQNKEELSSSEGRTYVQKFTAKALKELFEYNEKEIKLIVDKALLARKAREAAKKAKDAVRTGVNDSKLKKKQWANLPTKLVDCWSKNRLSCELFIAEGDSAASGIVEGRNSEFVAVFPIRGKIISSYKNSSEKIFANQEVINLIKAIGLELDTKTYKLIYDKNKLRYGKIFLAADADPDGASIRNLLIEMFWWLCPELILNGHIYTTTPPLFRITTNKNKYIFLKDANELEKYKNNHIGEKYLINRNKGLGEQDASELAETLLNPETRNVSQITVSNKQEAADLIECLLGPSVPPRREYLLKHSEEANDVI